MARATAQSRPDPVIYMRLPARLHREIARRAAESERTVGKEVVALLEWALGELRGEALVTRPRRAREEDNGKPGGVA